MRSAAAANREWLLMRGWVKRPASLLGYLTGKIHSTPEHTDDQGSSMADGSDVKVDWAAIAHQFRSLRSEVRKSELASQRKATAVAFRGFLASPMLERAKGFEPSWRWRSPRQAGRSKAGGVRTQRKLRRESREDRALTRLARSNLRAGRGSVSGVTAVDVEDMAGDE
jgi:hypothetical protein